MKIFSKLKVLLVSSLLAFTTQCSSDKVDVNPGGTVSSTDVQPMMVISSAEQLAADTSFIAAVKMNRKVTKTLFQRMRVLGSNAAREQQAAKIAQLINQVGSQDNASALAKEFGFASKQEFANSIFVLFKRTAELKGHYSNYNSIDSKLQRDAYDLVINKQERSFLTDPVTSGEADICPECPFNNCNECGGARSDPKAADDGDDGSAQACKDACNGNRQEDYRTAEAVALVELVACGGMWKSFQDFLVEIGQAEVAPYGGAMAGLGCASIVYSVYNSSIRRAENNYIICVNGCK